MWAPNPRLLGSSTTFLVTFSESVSDVDLPFVSQSDINRRMCVFIVGCRVKFFCSSSSGCWHRMCIFIVGCRVKFFHSSLRSDLMSFIVSDSNVSCRSAVCSFAPSFADRFSGSIYCSFAAIIVLDRRQDGHPACRKSSVGTLNGADYLTGALRALRVPVITTITSRHLLLQPSRE